MTEETRSRAGEMLFARLELASSEARAFLLTSPRKLESLAAIGEALAKQADACGRKVRMLVAEDFRTGANEPPSAPEVVRLTEAKCLDRDYLHSLLDGDSYTVAVRDNFLGAPQALMLASMVDGVIVVVQRGRTAQADLIDMRMQLDQFGGRLLDAVLLD